MVWQFIQDQILGMRWLNALIGAMLTSFGIDTQTRIGGSVQFFLYDVRYPAVIAPELRIMQIGNQHDFEPLKCIRQSGA